MKSDKIEILERALAREKQAKKAAEQILEEKSRELYFKSQELTILNQNLESLVKEKTAELQGIFDTMVDAFVVINLEGKVLKFNDAAEDLFGFTAKDNIHLLSLVQEDERARVVDSFKTLLKTGVIKDFKVNIKTKYNTLRTVHINASVIYDSNKQPVAANGIVRDITEDEAYERKLFDSQNRLSALISNLELGVLLEDENRDIVIANQRFCDFFEMPVEPQALTGVNCIKAAEQSKHLVKNPEEFVARLDEILKNKQLVLGDTLNLNSGVVLERDFIPIYQDGHYGGHLWTYKDITLSSKFSANLEAQKQKYSNIITNMNLGLVEVNRDDNILTVNEAFEKMSGYSKEFLLGKNASSLLLENVENGDISTLIKDAVETKSNTVEVKIRKKNNELGYWLLSSARNYDIEGQFIGYIWIHLDITQMRQLQDQRENLLSELARSNDELQEYAHVVSHDLKSPLRSINALVSWIKEDNRGTLGKSTQKNLELIEETLEKMEHLISDVLIYSSLNSKEISNEQVDTMLLLEGIIKLLHVPENVVITMDEKLPVIYGNGARIQQVFQNLISNAIRYSDKEKNRINVGYESIKGYHKFWVADNGIGIHKKYHDKIFKIFQSLNNTEGSTGIGLAIVNKIVKMYEGQVWLESEEGKGSTFYFTLKK